VDSKEGFICILTLCHEEQNMNMGLIPTTFPIRGRLSLSFA